MPAEHQPREVVVFDVDDTVCLERDYVASGFAALDPVVEAAFRIRGFSDIAWRHFTEGRRGRIFDAALRELGVSFAPADIAELVARYRNHRPRMCLLPDARFAMERLYARGVRLAVLTDGPAESQMAKVEALGLAKFAEVIVITGTLGEGYAKPHPYGFEHIAKVTGARSFAYVADNPTKDFVAPKALGWTTVRVQRAAGLHAERQGGPDIDITVDDLSVIPDLLAPMMAT